MPATRSSRSRSRSRTRWRASCEHAGADVTAVADIMGADPRIGRAFLNAGLGYGGYCFPKDVAALERLSERFGYPFPLLERGRAAERGSGRGGRREAREALWNLEASGSRILGLAFKPDTDDVRFSPALSLARLLLASGAQVVGCDPQRPVRAKEELPELELANDVYEAATGAHAPWSERNGRSSAGWTFPPPRGHDLPADRRREEPAGPGGSSAGLLVLPDGTSAVDPTTSATGGRFR